MQVYPVDVKRNPKILTQYFSANIKYFEVKPHYNLLTFFVLGKGSYFVIVVHTGRNYSLSSISFMFLFNMCGKNISSGNS